MSHDFPLCQPLQTGRESSPFGWETFGDGKGSKHIDVASLFSIWHWAREKPLSFSAAVLDWLTAPTDAGATDQSAATYLQDA